MSHWLFDIAIPALDTIRDALSKMEGKRVTKARRECEEVCSYAQTAHGVLLCVQGDEQTLAQLDGLLFELMRMKMDGLTAAMRSAKVMTQLWQLVVINHPEWERLSASEVATRLMVDHGLDVHPKSISNFRASWNQN
ncbi:MAG: hypothetical protein AAGI11_04430 [Pseudomonadota bacterium]